MKQTRKQKILCFLGFHKWINLKRIPFPVGWKYTKEDYYWPLVEKECEHCGRIEKEQILNADEVIAKQNGRK